MCMFYFHFLKWQRIFVIHFAKLYESIQLRELVFILEVFYLKTKILKQKLLFACYLIIFDLKISSWK